MRTESHPGVHNMNIETILIIAGCLGVTGSLVAIAMGYLVHLNEERDREWWRQRNIDFSDGASRNGSYTTASQKTAPKELRSACAAAEVTSGGMVPSDENTNRKESSTSKRH